MTTTQKSCKGQIPSCPIQEEDVAESSYASNDEEDHFYDPLVDARENSTTHLEKDSRRLQKQHGFYPILKARQLALHGAIVWVRRCFVSPLQICGLVLVVIFIAILTHEFRAVPTTSSSSLAETPRRPPLEDLIGPESNHSDNLIIKGDVQWLLDFAIIGHGKCATTVQLNWLYHHPDVLMYKQEINFLSRGNIAEMVRWMYALPEGNQKRGYKAPNDIRSEGALETLRTFFPKTKLIVGVRHPVKWFESYYNYHSRHANERGQTGLDRLPEQMVGRYLPDRVLFHVHLNKLGKTNSTLDRHEKQLLGIVDDDDDTTINTPPPRMENPIFLYEVSQPFDTTQDRHIQYRVDLQNFLELPTPLPPIETRTGQSPNYHYAMDICDDKFHQLRTELADVGRLASEWILQYFLVQPDVTVSSPDHFKKLLQSWSQDPCEKG